MSVWTTHEKHGFETAVNQGIGQIGLQHKLGKYLFEYAKTSTIKNILEIGTWNGYGSTRCIVEGLKQRDASSPYIFYSLETNKDKCMVAQDLYKDIPNIHILNETLYNDERTDIYDIFPELLTNQEFQYWHKIDMENMRSNPLFLDRSELPVMFDLVLLDGGEFTTWYEYCLLKDRCKILALDDTNVSKCRRIVAEIKSQPDKWTIELDDNERNGVLIAVRKNL